MTIRVVEGQKSQWKAPVLKVVDVKELTRNGTGSGTDGSGIPTMQKQSDARIKTDVRTIGISPTGLPIYEFRYLHDKRLHTGVMAQDVLVLKPEAVSISALGTYIVDYSQLDVAPHTLN